MVDHDEFDWVHSQRGCKFAQDHERRVPNRPLDLTNIRPVHLCVKRQSFLRQALLASQ